MPVMHSLVPVRIASKRGYTVHVTPEGAYVPDDLVEQATRYGCAPKEPEPAPKEPEPELTDDGLTMDRAKVVKAAIEKVIAKNDPKDFTQGGLPRTVAVKRALDGPATNEEIIESFHALSGK